MRITLLDPGLTSTMGHHFDLNVRLVRALSRLGHEVDVHGFANPDPRLPEMAEAAGIVLSATFRAFTYHDISPSQSPKDLYRLMADATAADLSKVPESDLWVWPTMAPYHLEAALSHGGTVRHLGCLWWTPRHPLAIGASSWGRSARRLAQEKSPIAVGAFDDSLCRAYQSFSPGLDVLRLPCPHDGAANDRQPTSLRRIGFFGHQRVSRGLALVPQLVTILVQRGYHVIVQDSGDAIQSKSTHPNIELLRHVDDFGTEIARCDLVIWPSHWESYLECHSGVVSECIATGVPIIAPSGCMPAEILTRFGSGTFFHELSVEAILEAVELAELEFPEIFNRAQEAARLWHAENGTDRLAALIDEHVGGRS